MNHLILGFVALIAGLVQGVTGFGAGIIIMLLLPNIFPLPQAAGLSGAICLCLLLTMVYRYRKAINYKLITLPTLFFILGSSWAISVSTQMDNRILKLVFAVFLILLSLYFLLNKKEVKLKPSVIVMFLTGFLSGLSDGFFGIGGPLMVILFLSLTKTVDEYMGNLQLVFALVSIYSLVFRIYQGILTIDLVDYGLVGTLGILIGLQIGNRLIDRLNPDLIRKLTYVIIGLSGVLTLVTTLI